MGRGVKRNVLLFSICILLALLPRPFAYADQTAGKVPPADVLFAVYPAQPAAQEFLPVVADAIRYKLVERGLVTVTPDGAKDTAQLTAQARKASSPIVLVCGISANETQLAISLEWRDLQKTSAPVRVESSGPLDLTLDSVILKSLDSLIGSVGQRIDQLAAARAAAMRATAAQQGPATVTAPAQGAATTPAATGAGAQAAGGTATPATPTLPPAEGVPVPAAPPQTVPAPPSAVERPYFVLDAGVAPFVPVGAASLYFPIGLLPSVDARMVFPTSSGRFAIGLHAAAVYFQAAGTADSSQDFLVPLGVDLRYEIGNGAPFVLFAHLSGGLAMLVIATASQGTLVDFPACFRSGIGASFMFTPSIGISFAVDYEIYFEMPYLIMGFTPSVAVSLKL